MNILIIGSNGLLARRFINKFEGKIENLHLTATKLESLDNIESIGSIYRYEMDFNERQTIGDFFSSRFDKDYFDLILFCSSPFEGKISGLDYKELDIWSNSYNAALKICRLASNSLKAEGKLIFVGSVVGYIDTIASSCVPYSVFKGSLSLLVEGFNKEVGKSSYYINLGSFREQSGDSYLGVDEVINQLSRIVDGSVNESQVNIMCKSEEKEYLNNQIIN